MSDPVLPRIRIGDIYRLESLSRTSISRHSLSVSFVMNESSLYAKTSIRRGAFESYPAGNVRDFDSSLTFIIDINHFPYPKHSSYILKLSLGGFHTWNIGNSANRAGKYPP
jgi:hypothetical protein